MIRTWGPQWPISVSCFGSCGLSTCWVNHTDTLAMMQLSIVINSNYSTVVVTTNSDNSNNSSNNGTLPLLKVLLTATFVAVALMAPERPLEWREGLFCPVMNNIKRIKHTASKRKGSALHVWVAEMSGRKTSNWHTWCQQDGRIFPL